MTTTTRFHFRSALVAAAASVVLAACGGGGGSDAAAPATGTLRVALTDAPACGFDQVNVTVERVRVHTSMTANDSDAGWVDIPVNPARKIDLLSLQNGTIAELGQTTLPAGTYTQIRLVLTPNGSGIPANSVKPTGGTETPVDTPSAAQSGIKLINGFTVQSGQLTDIVIDFDACRSIVMRGNGSYGLKPVMQMVPRTGAVIAGYVEAVQGVTVSAQKDGKVVRSTQANADGKFMLSLLDAADYDVVFTGPGFTTSVMPKVPAAVNVTTNVSSDLIRVKMPISASGTVSGKLLPTEAQSTGSVRALQAVGSVAAVEVAHTNVNPTTGEYVLSLPLAAPRLLTYKNPIQDPIPSATQANSGKYKLEAAATGYVPTQTAEITVSGTPQTLPDITLPKAP